MKIDENYLETLIRDSEKLRVMPETTLLLCTGHILSRT